LLVAACLFAPNSPHANQWDRRARTFGGVDGFDGGGCASGVHNLCHDWQSDLLRRSSGDVHITILAGWVEFLVGLVYNEIRINCDSIFVPLDQGFLECDFDLRLRDNRQKKEHGEDC